MRYNIIILIITLSFTLSCNQSVERKNNIQSRTNKVENINHEQLIGSWVQTIPGLEDENQGFVLNKDYTAQSINIHTFKYDKWSFSKDTLFLSGHSQGVKEFGENIDTMLIKKLNSKELIIAPVNARNLEEKYVRQNNNP
ncbi:lipocalin family protein [Elizabethkingia anophelis]|uniref:lipocalin family protein n=1 Tax=Elizabethkingia anophelis TaxID=1117645 RepID=UPI001371FC2F|nr:lipocalin family protein [Elizabethkingia anophelis]MYY27360.1 hypothetical protein [Elizabethkingia anophelis]